jgi:PAS domain S-box-containing protein
MSWINNKPEGLLRYWLTNTKAPMIASMPDGTILWVNRSFERMIGYVSAEIVGKLSWKDLTQDKDDLAADIAMMEELATGERTQYQLQKEYLTKHDKPVKVVIDVMRYPNGTEQLECFLVTAIPIDEGLQFAMGELSAIREILLGLSAVMSTPQQNKLVIGFDDIQSWYKNNPLISTALTIVIATLLFGERVIEIIQAFGIKFGTTPTP